jgi:hypothetical protein
MTLTLISNPNPPLNTQRWKSETRLVVADDVVVDHHYARVLALADRLKEEHARKEAAEPTYDRCPLLDVPEGYSEDEIGAAIRILEADNFEYLPARIHGPTTAMYLRDNRNKPAVTQH